MLGEAGEVKSIFSMWQKNKTENTEMMDRTIALLKRIGLLDDDGKPAPAVDNPFAKFDTRWFQSAANLIDHAGLVEDGILGDENSKTRQYYKAYQARKGHKNPDGIPGPVTLGDVMKDLQALEASGKLK